MATPQSKKDSSPIDPFEKGLMNHIGKTISLVIVLFSAGTSLGYYWATFNAKIDKMDRDIECSSRIQAEKDKLIEYKSQVEAEKLKKFEDLVEKFQNRDANER